MAKNELEERTKRFAVRVIRFVGEFPKNNTGDVLGKQLLRSGTSVGANYREANRGESRNDFIHKIGIVEKEAAETVYWLELCKETLVVNASECNALLQEANELLSIFVTIGKHSRARAVSANRKQTA